MVISDLNYLEKVSESSIVTGGSRKKLAGLGINLNIITQVAVPVAIAINLGKGTVTVGTGVIQNAMV
ncbi:hypothetical protein ACKFKG_01995 [Phormidesmis sp. 146-35]